MTQPSPNQYLESKVFTASQPQLHIMLLDGALRFGRQAADMWNGGSEYTEIEPILARMTNIVEELLQGLSCGTSEFSDQLAEQYAFAYRELVSSRVNQQQSQLETCLKLLTYQRETWKLATDQLDTTEVTAASAPAPTPTPAPTPATPHIQLDTTSAPQGLSLEA